MKNGTSVNYQFGPAEKFILLLFLFLGIMLNCQQFNCDDFSTKISFIDRYSFQRNNSQNALLKKVVRCFEDASNKGNKTTMLKSGLYSQIVFSEKHDYGKSIEFSANIEKLIEDNGSPIEKFFYYKTNANNYKALGLFKESVTSFYKTASVLKFIKSSDNDLHKYCFAIVYLDKASYFERLQLNDSLKYYLDKSLNTALKINKSHLLEKNGVRNQLLGDIYVSLAQYHLKTNSKDFSKSYLYFKTAQTFINNSKTANNSLLKINFYNSLSNFYFQIGNYEESIHNGLLSLELEETNSHPYLRKNNYQYIAKSFFSLNNVKKYEDYIAKYIVINDSIIKADKRIRASSIEHIMSLNTNNHSTYYKYIIYTGSIVIILLLLILCYLWRKKHQKLHSNYLLIVNDIENNYQQLKGVTKKASEVSAVSDGTYHKISAKLEKFEKNLGYLKREITLTYLASQFKSNPKSLSIVIKNSKGKTFNSYVNDLRIDYITRKLYREKIYREFKIDYLAEECGFGSSKVFVQAFKKKTGVTPSYYISNLKKSKSSNI